MKPHMYLYKTQIRDLNRYNKTNINNTTLITKFT